MTELSNDTRARLLDMFRQQDAPEAERLLADDCGENLPLIGAPATPHSLERIRFAALRVSGGDMGRLRDAVRLAQTDWRDLLVAAEFANDVHAHQEWKPRRFDSNVADAWKAGSMPAGIEFIRNDSVEILAGPRCGKRGTIVALVGLEPEPRYLVKMDSGSDFEEFQQTLRRTPKAN